LQNIDACGNVNGNTDRNIALSYLNFETAAVCYAYLTRITGKDDTLKYAEAMNSNEFRRFIEMKDFNDTIVGQTLPYYSALQFYLYFQMNIDYNESKSYVQNLWDHIKALNLPKPNNDAAYCLISLNLLQIGYAYYDHFFQDMDSLLQYFDKNANEKENAEYLRNEFERQYEYLRPGRQIKDVELTDTLGNKYLLSDFKDKIIYVKMWSLGCKGCIQEIPEYNELLTTFTDTNVVFISVARDREQYTDKWKAAIRSYDLKGLNFISENGLNLGFHGLPKYYIIGKNNTIVTLKAPHPRSLRLKPMLEELIKEESKNE
jgi:thiol-disulfide isomerase/thioredoxin